MGHSLCICKIESTNGTCSQNSSTGNQTTTTVEPFTCPSDGYFPVPGECSGNYYICTDGVAHPQVCRVESTENVAGFQFGFNQTCPGNMVFDPATSRCESPDTVSCRGTTTTQSARCWLMWTSKCISKNSNYCTIHHAAIFRLSLRWIFSCSRTMQWNLLHLHCRCSISTGAIYQIVSLQLQFHQWNFLRHVRGVCFSIRSPWNVKHQTSFHVEAWFYHQFICFKKLFKSCVRI